MGLGGWWWSEVKVECAPAAYAWLSVCLLEFYFLDDYCWVVLVSGEVMGCCGRGCGPQEKVVNPSSLASRF